MSAVLALALFLGAYKQVPVEQARAICAGYGLPPGTSEYADCVKVEHKGFELKHEDDLGGYYSVDSGIGTMHPIPQEESEPVSPLPSSLNYHPFGDRTFRSSYVSGRNRICSYDRMGSRENMTVDATSLCPVSDGERGLMAGRQSPESRDYHPFGNRMLRSSYVSGRNRICVYDRTGSREETTVDSTALCPIN